MGILDGLFGGGAMADPVAGTAQVVSASMNRGRGVYQSCGMQPVVQADGVPATAVELNELVHRSRWPMPGMVLPVTVDRAQPRNVKVAWDQVQNSRDRARGTAEALAAQLRNAQAAAAHAPS